MSYFDVCSTRLGSGSVIEAGNWGSVISKLGWPHGRALHEAALEHVRETEFPDAPSRLRSAFVVPDRGTAEFYRSHVSGGIGWIYEVEFIKEAQKHRANWNGVAPSGPIGLK